MPGVVSPIARLGLRPLLVGLLGLMLVCSVAFGPSGASLFGALGQLARGAPLDPTTQLILLQLRMPRALLGALVGAALAVSGALMQGLFRNPLADPALVGVSSGAGLGAVSAITLGGLLPAGVQATLGDGLISAAAFGGGWLTTLGLYRIATSRGRTSVATMLLAGIAVSALASAATGLLVYRASETELRSITFWQLGSLAGATPPRLVASAALVIPALLLAGRLGDPLNKLSLGEAEAAHMGVSVQRLKRLAILCVAAATGASVAAAGSIGFIGIVVPHLLRLISGPDHRPLLPNAALLGASLLLAADLLARTLAPPAELPIGVITALLGAPFFLWILLSRQARWGL